ncbi:MAG: hypothetical protein RR825_03990, partial [Ruthenibacterium sp.]
FFAAQPEDAGSAPAEGFDDFFAAQPVDEPVYTDAAFSNEAFVAEPNFQGANEFYDAQQGMDAVQPMPDNTFLEDAQQIGDLSVNEAPFDIAVPEQSAAAPLEPQPQIFLDTSEEHVEKRKYTPVFTQPIPSALDELRSGLVKPASPISSVAATQVPVVITAADAAEAEAAAREAAQQAAAEAAVAEAAALAAAERAAAEAEASRYGYEEPAPEHAGFGYSNPVQDDDYRYNAPASGGLSTDEFNLPVTADVPEQMWAAPADSTMTPGDSFVPAYENEPAAPAMFDYDNAPIQGIQAAAPQDNSALFNYDDAPMADDFAQYADSAPEQAQPAAQTPEDYANNLQAMFGNDDTYAALDAVQPQEFEAEPVYDAQPGEDLSFDSEENFAAGNEDAPDAFHAPDDTFGGNFADLAMTDDGDSLGEAPAFNPFQSDEWLDDSEDTVPKKGARKHSGDYNYDDGSHGGAPHGKKQKGGGSKMPLAILLIVLVVAIIGVLAYLLLSGKFGKQPEISSVSVAPLPVSSVSVAPSVPEVPAVDPIPRDEWYMRVANKVTPLPAEFKIETANCKDGIPV